MPLAAEKLRVQGTPQLAAFPRGVPRRLVDDRMVHYEASIGGFAERYRRGETPHTVHVWWARRPHTAMRALVFACLSEDRSEDAIGLMRELSCCTVPPLLLLEAAKQSLSRGRKRRPRVLDMFGGSGTIGFEAACLGAETYSLDSNELSVFIQKSTLCQGNRFGGGGLRRQLEESGKRVLTALHEATQPLFPCEAMCSDTCGRTRSRAKRAVFGSSFQSGLGCRRRMGSELAFPSHDKE